MSVHQEDEITTTDNTASDQRSSELPQVVQFIINVENPPGASLNLQIGDHNRQNFPSAENLACTCGASSSNNSSPVTTIRRNSSRDLLDVEDFQNLDVRDNGSSEDIRSPRKFSLGSNSSPITIQRVITRHQCSSDSNSPMSIEPVINSVPSIVVYQRTTDMLSDSSSVSSNYDTADEEPDYMPMTGHCALNTNNNQRENKENYLNGVKYPAPNTKPRARKLRKIPAHKLDEARATPGFRTDVNKELKRVNRILRPYKSKDGYYILWQFDDYVIALSVTFLKDVKTFPIHFDKERSSWMIKEDGPISSSLSTLIQIYIQNRIKLPLMKRQSLSPPKQTERSQETQSRQSPSLSSIGRCPSDLSPMLPRARVNGLRSHSCGEIRVPCLPPKPSGFLALKQPIIQEIEDDESSLNSTESVITRL